MSMLRYLSCGLLYLLFSTGAQAWEVTICNESDHPIRYAANYDLTDQSDLIYAFQTDKIDFVSGWYFVKVGDCSDVWFDDTLGLYTNHIYLRFEAVRENGSFVGVPVSLESAGESKRMCANAYGEFESAVTPKTKRQSMTDCSDPYANYSNTEENPIRPRDRRSYWEKFYRNQDRYWEILEFEKYTFDKRTKLTVRGSVAGFETQISGAEKLRDQRVRKFEE